MLYEIIILILKEFWDCTINKLGWNNNSDSQRILGLYN